MKQFFLTFFLSLLLFSGAHAQHKYAQVTGIVMTDEGTPIEGALIYIDGTKNRTVSNTKGEFSFHKVRIGRVQINATFVGHTMVEKHIHTHAGKQEQLRIVMSTDKRMLGEAEVFGERYKRPEKLDYVTRLPLRLDEQAKSISVISHKMIQEQGVLTLSDAVRNAPGLSTFATYGNTTESLTARGFRGIPTLKNGVRVHSDFRGQGMLTDMQGVETIQILRGSAAITQGVGNDIGSAGGVINIATKVPHFVNKTEVGLRTGSWGQFRPTVDWQYVLSSKAAMRFNAAFERRDNYRKYVQGDRVYLNPSFVWRPSRRSTFHFEMEHLYDSRTPDQGTVNLSADSVRNIYHMPSDKFMGFKTDNQTEQNTTYTTRFVHDLGQGYSIRLALAGSHLDIRKVAAMAKAMKSAGKTGKYNLRQRTYGGSHRIDDNLGFQADFIGKDIFTGAIRHTFNAGFDFTNNTTETVSTNSPVVDTIDVLGTINNVLPARYANLKEGTPTTTRSYAYGFLLQDVMTFNRYAKLSLGLRYSHINGGTDYAAANSNGSAWDPYVGVILTPVEDFNVFASYTHTSSLRSATRVDEQGQAMGAQRDKQFEAGVKAEFFKHRLRFNLTYFHILNNDISYAAMGEAGQELGYYIKAGDIRRQGIEAELTGRILPTMDIVLGYSYLDAAYRNSPTYYNGSAPMNTAKHLANGWFNYRLDRGLLRNLAFGVGAYYVGARNLAEYTNKIMTGHQIQPNTPPFKTKPYTTLNVQASYRYEHFTLRAFLNNVLNSTGYTSYYRGGYLNPTDPRNFAVSLSYSF